MTSKAASYLLKSIKVGDLTLPNKIIMAPLTRLRADPKTLIPTELHVEYYSQRATAGLIISEASPISKSSLGYLGGGALFTPEQVEGWKKVNHAVHNKEGKIFAQIYHMGRVVRSEYAGEQPIAPSAIKLTGPPPATLPPFEMPRAMTRDDMKRVTEQFVQAALNAKEAGFDGVEVHAGNGYLLDSFIRDSANKRTDKYGGCIENRCRFPLEVLDAVIDIFGKHRVGLKVSPAGRYQDMYDSDPVATFGYFFKQAEKRGIAYIQSNEADDDTSGTSPYGPGSKQLPSVCKALKPYFKGPLMINYGFTPETAVQTMKEGHGDLVSFGKSFIANPDYVARVKYNWPLNALDLATVPFGGAKGYTDYPFYEPSISKTDTDLPVVEKPKVGSKRL